ncbi:MAG: hypothetical protein QMD14_04140 [Candidatus Aenigmarchaeota archaeon]|nr:hypothetical protein [Candidatus Aenigmarchaeota archaeon]
MACKIKIPIFGVLLFLTILFLTYFVLSEPSLIYTIRGYALNLEGNPINGSVTGFIIGNKTNTSNVINGYWELNFSNIPKDAEFNLGIRVNTTNETGYFYIKKFGAEPLVSTATCKDQTWHIAGLVLYPERNITGTIKVALGNSIATSNVINGNFDFSVTTCLISGELYKLELEVTSGKLYGYYSTKVVGK